MGIILFLFGVVNSHGQIRNLDIEKYSNSVAYLSDTKFQYEVVNGKRVELWYRDLKLNKLFPITGSSTGTGFFVYNEYSYYLVTAEHVAQNLTLESDVTIVGQNSKPYTQKLKDMVYNEKMLDWTIHPNSDVAVVLLKKEYVNHYKTKSITLSLEYFADTIPDRNLTLTAIGFPLNMGIGEYFSPISKSFRPASNLMEILNTNKNRMDINFLLESPTTFGFSGSPLFKFPNTFVADSLVIYDRSTKIFGLIQGTMSNKRLVNSNGFGIVVPSKFIIETIEMAPKFNGILEYYYDDGKKWSEIEIKNGNAYNVLYNLDNNGYPLKIGTLKDGNGSMNVYNKNGDIFKIKKYVDGKLKESNKIN